MGAIQGSMNKMLGTAAAGIAIANKMAPKEEDENVENLKEADTLLKKAEAEEDLDKLQGEYKAGKAEVKMWKQGMVDIGGGNYMQTGEDLSQDIRMRNKALRIMNQKIKARKLQISAYKEILGGKR